MIFGFEHVCLCEADWWHNGFSREFEMVSREIIPTLIGYPCLFSSFYQTAKRWT